MYVKLYARYTTSSHHFILYISNELLHFFFIIAEGIDIIGGNNMVLMQAANSIIQQLHPHPGTALTDEVPDRRISQHNLYIIWQNSYPYSYYSMNIGIIY